MFELVLTGVIMCAICLICMCICEQVHICKSRKVKGKKRKAKQERILLKLFAAAAFSACALTWAAAIMFFVSGV